MTQPAPTTPTIVNVTQIQKGCGCLSGCGTLLGLLAAVVVLSDLGKWIKANEDPIFFSIAGLTLVGSVVLWIFVQRKKRQGGQKKS